MNGLRRTRQSSTDSSLAGDVTDELAVGAHAIAVKGASTAVVDADGDRRRAIPAVPQQNRKILFPCQSQIALDRR